eukprot:4450804-Alexandrium_andersonii.AAC.1
MIKKRWWPAESVRSVCFTTRFDRYSVFVLSSTSFLCGGISRNTTRVLRMVHHARATQCQRFKVQLAAV